VTRDRAEVCVGLDVGTSGLKAVALDAAGSVVAEASADYPLLTPAPGWTEQDPNAWWRAAAAALRTLTERVGADRIGGVGVSGQMHGMVALDADGVPLRPALLWNDQRTAAQVALIERTIPRDELVRRTGNPAVTGFQLPKILWLRANEPAAFARLRSVLFPKDWIAFRLTGERRSEATDASGSGAFRIDTRDWDEEVLARLDLDPALLPELVASDAVVGEVGAAVAAETGLRPGTPVVAGAGDNAAAATALGLGTAAPELGSVSLGTSGVLFATAPGPTPDPQGRVHLFAHADGGWTLLGVTLSAAGSLAWWLRTLAPHDDVGGRVERALKRPAGAGGVTFTPFLTGERSPFLDPDLRGGFAGLSLASEPDDLVRAVLEGVAFSLADVWSVMRPLGVPERLLATGGGARGDGWVRLVADVLEVPIGVPTHVPGAAHGAAVLAWRALGTAVPAPSVERWLEPRPSPDLAAAYARYREHAPSLDRAAGGST
jgi:xylulokinase